jgi:hypothetical protein
MSIQNSHVSAGEYFGSQNLQFAPAKLTILFSYWYFLRIPGDAEGKAALARERRRGDRLETRKSEQ